MSTGWYWSLAYKSITKIRGGLVDGVSRKMLRLSPQGGTESKVLTVMIADVHRITTSLVYVHEIWVAPIETAIGTWLLCRQVGLSGLAVLALIAGMQISTPSLRDSSCLLPRFAVPCFEGKILIARVQCALVRLHT